MTGCKEGWIEGLLCIAICKEQKVSEAKKAKGEAKEEKKGGGEPDRCDERLRPDDLFDSDRHTGNFNVGISGCY